MPKGVPSVRRIASVRMPSHASPMEKVRVHVARSRVHLLRLGIRNRPGRSAPPVVRNVTVSSRRKRMIKLLSLLRSTYSSQSIREAKSDPRVNRKVEVSMRESRERSDPARRLHASQQQSDYQSGRRVRAASDPLLLEQLQASARKRSADWWARLRADPVRYRAYLDRQKADREKKQGTGEFPEKEPK